MTPTLSPSDIPARLDRLPWSPWHWRVVLALGVAWVLDGLEVTLVGSLGPTLQRPDTNGLGRVVPRVAGIRARSAAPCSVRRSRTLDC